MNPGGPPILPIFPRSEPTRQQPHSQWIQRDLQKVMIGICAAGGVLSAMTMHVSTDLPALQQQYWPWLAAAFVAEESRGRTTNNTDVERCFTLSFYTRNNTEPSDASQCSRLAS